MDEAEGKKNDGNTKVFTPTSCLTVRIDNKFTKSCSSLSEMILDLLLHIFLVENIVSTLGSAFECLDI